MGRVRTMKLLAGNSNRRLSNAIAGVLDLDPAQITAPVLNRYLAIRDAALI